MDLNKNLVAVVLVGGLGTRLASVVKDCPKPMIDVNGKPFLEYLVDFLKKNGISRVVFCVGYKKEVVRDYFGNGEALGVEIDYAVEEELKGTAGALKNAAEFLKEDDLILMLNGDSFVDFSLRDFISFHCEKDADFTYLVCENEEKDRFGNLVLDDDGKLLDYQEKEAMKEGVISAGVYLISKKILDFIPEGVKYSLEEDLMPKLIEKGCGIYGFLTENQLIDIGTPESLEYFKENWSKFFDDEILNQIKESIDVKKLVLERCVGDIRVVVDMLISMFLNGNKLLICGNGGSAADSQHIAAEFISSFRSEVKRPSLPAIALTTDTSILTAFTNDFGVNGVFARQVEGLGAEGDILLAISTSGNSVNVVEAVREAKKKGVKTVGLLGKDGGALRDEVDFSIIVPVNDTPRIQEAHVMIYHIICDLVEKGMIEKWDLMDRKKAGIEIQNKLNLVDEKSNIS